VEVFAVSSIVRAVDALERGVADRVARRDLEGFAAVLALWRPLL
jgi:hypothetical protein